MRKRVICALSRLPVSSGFQSSVRDLTPEPQRKSTYRMILDEGVLQYLTRVSRKQEQPDTWWHYVAIIQKRGDRWAISTQHVLEAESQVEFGNLTDGTTVIVSERKAAWLISRIENWENLPLRPQK